MSTAVRYTVAKRRQIEAERAAWLAARDVEYAAMPVDEFVALKVAEVSDLAAEYQERQREWAIRRHAELNADAEA